MKLRGDGFDVARGERGEQPLDGLGPAHASAFTARERSASTSSRTDAAVEVVVDDADRLHQRVGRGRADEAEAAPLELLRQRLRLGRRGRDVGAGPRRALAIGPERPDERRSDSPPAASSRAARGVGDRRLDLGPVADDPGVGEQALDVALAEPGDALDVEAVERVAEVLALAQDREPREPGLERLQGQLLVDARGRR